MFCGFVSIGQPIGTDGLLHYLFIPVLFLVTTALSYHVEALRKRMTWIFTVNILFLATSFFYSAYRNEMAPAYSHACYIMVFGVLVAIGGTSLKAASAAAVYLMAGLVITTLLSPKPEGFPELMFLGAITPLLIWYLIVIREQFRFLNAILTQQQKHQDEMARSSKLVALGTMASGIGHEINNPLTIVRASLDILQSLPPETELANEKVRNTFKKVIAATDRAAEIIAGIRGFSREGSQDPLSTIHVRDWVDNTLSFSRDRFRRHGIGLQIQLREDPTRPLRVKGRMTELSQILLNLLNNSFDAVQGTTAPWVKIEAKPVAGQIEISVTDSGPGIPADFQAKIFDSFFTTKEAGKGTGLGLSISRNLLLRFGGNMSLDASSPNTRFVILLPSGG